MAEDLLLLVTDDASGRLSAPAAQVDAGLGGANLVELTLRNKVDLSGEGDQGKPGRIIVRTIEDGEEKGLIREHALFPAGHDSRCNSEILPAGKARDQQLPESLAEKASQHQGPFVAD